VRKRSILLALAVGSLATAPTALGARSVSLPIPPPGEFSLADVDIRLGPGPTGTAASSGPLRIRLANRASLPAGTVIVGTSGRRAGNERLRIVRLLVATPLKGSRQAARTSTVARFAVEPPAGITATVSSRVATLLRSGPKGPRMPLPPALVGTQSSVIAGRFPAARAGDFVRYGGCLAARGGGRGQNAHAERSARCELLSGLVFVFAALMGREVEIEVVGEGTVSGALLPSPCSRDCKYFLPSKTGPPQLDLVAQPAPGWRLASAEEANNPFPGENTSQLIYLPLDITADGRFGTDVIADRHDELLIRVTFVRTTATSPPPPPAPPGINPSLNLITFSLNEVITRVRVSQPVNHVRLRFFGRSISAFLPFPGNVCNVVAGDMLACNGPVPANTDVTANVRFDQPVGTGTVLSEVFASADGGATGVTAQGTGP
jgi:hypothetical protein